MCFKISKRKAGLLQAYNQFKQRTLYRFSISRRQSIDFLWLEDSLQAFQCWKILYKYSMARRTSIGISVQKVFSGQESSTAYLNCQRVFYISKSDLRTFVQSSKFKRPYVCLLCLDDHLQAFYGQKTVYSSFQRWQIFHKYTMCRRTSIGLFCPKDLLLRIENLPQVFHAQKPLFRSFIWLEYLPQIFYGQKPFASLLQIEYLLQILSGQKVFYRSYMAKRLSTLAGSSSKAIISSTCFYAQKTLSRQSLCLNDLLRAFYDQKTSNISSMARRHPTGLLWAEDFLQFLFDRSSIAGRLSTGLLCLQDHLQIFYGQKTFFRSSITGRHSKGFLWMEHLLQVSCCQKALYIWLKDLFSSPMSYTGLYR